MPTRCLKCGAEVEDGWPVCRKCFEPVKRPGFFARLFAALQPRRVKISVSSSSPAVAGFTAKTVSLKVNEDIKIREAKTGETREYHSLDEVPEKFRELIRQAEQSAGSVQTTNSITWTDASGTVHNCKSLDELPPEMRALCEKALGKMWGNKDKTPSNDP